MAFRTTFTPEEEQAEQDAYQRARERQKNSLVFFKTGTKHFWNPSWKPDSQDDRDEEKLFLSRNHAL